MTAESIKKELQFEMKVIKAYRDEIASVRAGNARGEASSIGREGQKGDPVSRAACRVVDLEEEMRARIDHVWGHYLVYLDTESQRKIFKARYIDGLQFNRVALRLQYSVQHVKNVHGQGLKLIAKKVLIT